MIDDPGAKGMIVYSSGPVTLVGGAKLNPADLELALSFAPTLVAADGGADALLAAPVPPVAVIGDMDSLSDTAARAFADRLYRIEEQETTDFDKALRSIAAPLVLALGVTGGRFDHELAAMHTLVRRSGRICVVIGAESIVFVCPARLDLDLPKGTPFSLFPMGPVRLRSTGLRWPTHGLAFAPDQVIGTSNEVTGPVSLHAGGPLMLVILPRSCLTAVVAALTGPACQGWPDGSGTS
jgi:thiamine pyrophosphokinase